MSQATANKIAPTGPGRTAAAVLAWVVGRPHGRWATPRGRWVRTVATAGLLVTAVGAWALAIVQPWAFHPVEAAAGLTLMVPPLPRMRSSPLVNAELLAAGSAAVRPVRRDPFLSVDRPGRGVAALKAAPAAPASASSPPAAMPREAARDVFDAIRRLRLEMTMVGPDGTAWVVIDGREYRQGESVGGLEIVEIQEGRVKLRKGEITCLLRMD